MKAGTRQDKTRQGQIHPGPQNTEKVDKIIEGRYKLDRILIYKTNISTHVPAIYKHPSDTIKQSVAFAKRPFSSRKTAKDKHKFAYPISGRHPRYNLNGVSHEEPSIAANNKGTSCPLGLWDGI